MCPGAPSLPNDMLVTAGVRLVRNETATGSGRHCSVTASGAACWALPHTQRRQQSPFLPLTQRQERIASEPGGALEAFFGRAKPHAIVIIDNIPLLSITTEDGFALVQMACCTSVQVMLEIRDLPERQQSVRARFCLTPDGQVPKDNPFPGKPAYILGIRNIQDLMD